MSKVRLSINEHAELVARDGTVVGRLSAISVEIDPAKLGTIGALQTEQLRVEADQQELKLEDHQQGETQQGEKTPIAPTQKLFEVPSPEQLVWNHWLEAAGSKQKLDSTRRGLIRNALKLRTVEECCEAIDGLLSDPWWRLNRPRLELRYALRGNHAKGESDEDRIDSMREKGASLSGPMRGENALETLPSEQRGIMRHRMSQVVLMYRFPDDPNLRGVGNTALEELRKSGLAPVMGRRSERMIVIGWRRV